MITHPVISLPLMTSCRNMAPRSTAKTDSSLIIIVAMTGDAVFCPKICRVFLSVAVNHHSLNTADIIGFILVIVGIAGMNLKA